MQSLHYCLPSTIPCPKLCVPQECPPRRRPCPGGTAKDLCNCCDICLLQEHEVCMGRNGRCDVTAPYCERSSHFSRPKCTALVTLIRRKIRKYTKKMGACSTSRDYAERHTVIRCYTNVAGPTFYCKKKWKRNHFVDDCCVHGNSCHPNTELYDKISWYIVLWGFIYLFIINSCFYPGGAAGNNKLYFRMWQRISNNGSVKIPETIKSRDFLQGFFSGN